MFKNQYTLSKTWTLAGWDVDLNSAQERYAACDVIGCHALFLSKQQPAQLVFDCNDADTGFHSFLAPNSASMVPHGLSFGPDHIGHFQDGEFTRGLNWIDETMSFTGFQKSANYFRSQVDVHKFLRILISESFCCELCCRLKWLRAIGVVSPAIVLLGGPSANQQAYNYGRGKSSPTQRAIALPAGISTTVRDAYICVSLLAAFFDVEVADSLHLDSFLVPSVSSDIDNGYIYHSLAHLKDPAS